jgi:hypothetical protein
MKIFSTDKPILLVISGVLIALMMLSPACQAQTAATLDKHSRKIQKELSHYPAGTYLRLSLRDHSDEYGSLGTLSDSSFSITSSDTNKSETHLYSEIAGVEKEKEYIGEGTGSGHHFRHLVPIAIVSAAAATAAAIVVPREY